MVDGLAAILKQGVGTQSFTPLHVCPRAPGISHLLFADDTLLFFQATDQEALSIKEVLATYAQAT